MRKQQHKTCSQMLHACMYGFLDAYFSHSKHQQIELPLIHEYMMQALNLEYPYLSCMYGATAYHPYILYKQKKIAHEHENIPVCRKKNALYGAQYAWYKGGGSKTSNFHPER